MSRLTNVAGRCLLLLGLIPLTACQFTGVNSLELPFGKGGGSDDYQLTVEFESVSNLVPNSEVKVDEVTVGSVRKVDLDGWHARLTLGIERGVELPSNAIANIAQKSLLGASYVDLRSPAEPAPTLLKDGDTIPIARTGRFPETEETLSAVSLLLNGGGLSQLQTITRELNRALGGNEEQIRAFVAEVGTLAGDLADQRAGIVRALRSLDRMSARYARGDEQIKTALRDIPAGVDALAAERARLTKVLGSLGNLGDQVAGLVDESGENLRVDAQRLAGTLNGIANVGPKDFQTSLGSLTYPFPISSVVNGFRGDYLNLFITLDLSLKGIERDYLGGTPLAGVYSSLLGLIPGSSSAPVSNPLLDPLQGLGGLTPPTTGSGGQPDAASTPGAQPSVAPTPTAPSNPLTDVLSGLLGGGR